MSSTINCFIREINIDEDLSKLLQKGWQSKKINLYKELEKLGYSCEEIITATSRKLQKDKEKLLNQLNILIVQGIIEGYLDPDDL